MPLDVMASGGFSVLAIIAQQDQDQDGPLGLRKQFNSLVCGPDDGTQAATLIHMI